MSPRPRWRRRIRWTPASFPTSPASSKAARAQTMGFAKDGLVLRLHARRQGSRQWSADRRAGAQILRRFDPGAGCETRRRDRCRSLWRRDSSGAAEPASALLLAMVFAFIGGLILNVMPCVLPILAMKALALAGHGGRRTMKRRSEGFAYSAGAVLSFFWFRSGDRAAAPRRRGGGLGLPVAGAHRGGGLRASDLRRGPQSFRRVRSRLGHRRRQSGAALGRRSALSSPACWRWRWPRPAPRPSWRRRWALRSPKAWCRRC